MCWDTCRVRIAHLLYSSGSPKRSRDRTGEMVIFDTECPHQRWAEIAKLGREATGKVIVVQVEAAEI